MKHPIAEMHLHLVGECWQLIFTVGRKIIISEKKQDKRDLVVSEHKRLISRWHTHIHKLWHDRRGHAGLDGGTCFSVASPENSGRRLKIKQQHTFGSQILLSHKQNQNTTKCNLNKAWSSDTFNACSLKQLIQVVILHQCKIGLCKQTFGNTTLRYGLFSFLTTMPLKIRVVGGDGRS